jgi:hypothetical protein
MVKLLLDHGASLDHPYGQESILYEWALNGLIDCDRAMLNLFVYHGASPHLTLRRRFDNVLLFALTNGRQRSFRLLDECNEKHGRPRSRLHENP